MSDTMIARLEARISDLAEFGGEGTTIVIVDAAQIEAARDHIDAMIAQATGGWRVDLATTDPIDLQGEARRRFEDGIFERGRTPASVRSVFVTKNRFYVIPSVSARVGWVDVRGRTFQPSCASRDPIPGTHRPMSGDTLWYQEHRGNPA